MAALVDILAAGVVDDDGAALVNGVVYFYERGTTTKVTVYQDSDLTIPYANPLTLDDAGKAEVYIQNPVRIVIEDSLGNLIDDIASVGEVATLGADLIIGTDSSNYLIINSRIRSNLIPDVASFYTIGNDDFPWKEIHLDGGSEHGGRVYFDASDSKYAGSSEDGTSFEVGGFDDADFSSLDSVYFGNSQGIFGDAGSSDTTVPQVLVQSLTGDAFIRLQVNNSSSNAWDIRNDNSDSDALAFEYAGSSRFKLLSGGTVPVGLDTRNRGSGTATDINTIYANTIIKAWVYVESDGTLQSGVNLSCSKGGTGSYTYTFLTPMADANYAVIATNGGVGPFVVDGICTVKVKTANGFNIAIEDPSGAAINEKHSIIVVGAQS